MAESKRLTQLLDEYNLADPAHRAAVEQAYQVSAAYLAPLITQTTAAMLDDLRQAVQDNPDTVVVFLGRDGHSLALAAANLDPQFVARHCTEVVVSRAVVDAALQDLEVNSGRSFPELADFRDASGWVDPAVVTGARRALTDYLHRSGVPVGEPGSTVVLVDTSFKGTVQELLSALYPETRFHGCYAFYGASPHDPHPGSKKGYAVHLDADRSNGGRPFPTLPDDPAHLFGFVDAIGVVEYTLNGPLESPERMTAAGPVQTRLREDPNPLWGLNPIKVAVPFTVPEVREAAKTAMLLAVDDQSRAIAATDRASARRTLTTRVDRLREQIRHWTHGDPKVDPDFHQVMDAFVAHPDKWDVERLRDYIRRHSPTPAAAREIWQRFDRLSPEEKKTFTPKISTVASAFPGPLRLTAPTGPSRPGSAEPPPPGRPHAPRR